MNPELTFWDHVQELRKRLIRAMLGLGLASMVCYVFWKDIWKIVAYPLSQKNLHVDLIATSPMETLLTSFKISVIAGVIISFPWIMWQMWLFIGPAFFEKEKKIIIPSFLSSVIMFLAGATFSYFVVLPAGLTFLATYTEGAITQNWKQGDYASFISRFLLAFGFIFELPVLAFVLSRLGLVTARSMWGFFRYAIIVIFVVAALLTPGPDPVSQLLMAIPLLVLYLLSIGIAALASPKEEVSI